VFADAFVDAFADGFPDAFVDGLADDFTEGFTEGFAVDEEAGALVLLDVPAALLSDVAQPASSTPAAKPAIPRWRVILVTVTPCPMYFS
jgi:hypothetical protein